MEHSFLNKLATKLCEHFLSHVNNVSNYLVKLEMLIVHVLPLSCHKQHGSADCDN